MWAPSSSGWGWGRAGGTTFQGKAMRKLCIVNVLLVLTLITIGCGKGTLEDSTLVQATCVGVIDGDTIEVLIDGQIYTVRYIGMDTPEIDDPRPDIQAVAEEATLVNRNLVEGKAVKLEKDVSETDRYGRLLRYVYVGDTFVNADLVASGYAWAKSYPPDVKYDALLKDLETEARETYLGIWCNTTVACDIQITNIFYDGIVPSVESDEYVEVTNTGDGPQDITGWLLIDFSDGNPSFTFPSFIMASGQRIRVYTNEYHPEWGGFSFEYGKAIWNNTDPDTAALYNAEGQKVSIRSY
jgi:endonuclease YncB( thermonuclease family)